MLEELNIQIVTQPKTWMKRFKSGDIHRLRQPVGKQYSYGKGPEYQYENEKLKTEISYLKQQIDILKKYIEWERK